MGLFSCFPKFWRRSQPAAPGKHKGPRPYNAKGEKRDSGLSGMGMLNNVDPEKRTRSTSRSTAHTTGAASRYSQATTASLPNGVAIRTNVNPRYSAYASPISAEERYRDADDDWIDTPTTARVATSESVFGRKKGEDTLDDLAEGDEDEDVDTLKRRARQRLLQAEAAEMREEDRMDDFQMM